MVAEVFAGVSALKAAFDLAKGLKDIDNAARRNAVVIELQEQILTAQATQATLVETVGDLKKQVAQLETWETEKQRYELKDVGAGSLAYAVKEAMRNGEPAHQICANCYDHGHRRILQPRTTGLGRCLFCPDCKTEIFIASVNIVAALDAPVLSMSGRRGPQYES